MSVGRNDPCPCGSGRKYKHCHGSSAAPPALPTSGMFREAQRLLQAGDPAAAARRYREILEIDPEHADARHYLGMAMCFQRQIEAGLAHLRASVSLRPRDPVYRNNLALWLEEAGDLDGAERQFLEAVAVAPGHRDARLGLAKLLLRRRRNPAARIALEQHVRAHPDDLELGQLYAETQARLGEFTLARQHYRELLARAPGNHALRLLFAGMLRAAGHDDEARQEAEQVLAYRADSIEALRFLAETEERRNRLAEAERWATAALALVPHDVPARRLLARIQRRTGRAELALATLDATDAGALSPDDEAHHFMERGTILDVLGRHDAAFEAFRRGNEAARRFVERETGGVFYSRDRTRGYFDALRSYFTPDRVAQLARFAPESTRPEPLFIVGFPRSGTTLVEQMLGAHPNIHAGDELNALHLIESSAAARLGGHPPYPACLDAVLTPAHHDALREFRDHYLHLAREAGAIDAQARWFTDKMPLNETRLGLIRLLFPESPVLHVVRHPLDVVLSCYMNQLTHGDNCALALETAAFHYRQVMELVEQQVGDLGLRYTRIRYEDLLDDPEGELRRVLAGMGEAWDARCLAFHESQRVARTASYGQVARPLYQSSRERWRAYRRHLEPVIPALRTLIERLGYGLD